MHRRAFLTTAALGASAAAVGCGGVHARPELGVEETRALSARLERGLRMLDDQPFGSMLGGAPVTRPDLTEHVLRMTIESLLVLDVLRSIPEGATVPRELAETLAPRMPRLDRCIHTHHALLARMPAERRRTIDQRMREQPNLAMDVAEWIDGHAERIGVPADNRLRLRHSAVTVGTRLRRQSTNAVLADCTAKLDEVFARQSMPLPADLRAATAAVVDAMWQQVDDSAASASGGGGTLGAPIARTPPPRTSDWQNPLVVPSRFGSPADMMDPTEPVQWNDSWARPGDEEIRLGAIMMPLGLVTCGLLLIAGLIVLIAGEVQNGNWDGATHAEDATVE